MAALPPRPAPTPVRRGRACTSHPYRLQGLQYEDVNISVPLSGDTFEPTASRYDVLVVNFHAPWCPWCQRLGPTWEAATEEIHNRYPESDGRIRLAKVDCTAEVDLCRKHFITAFPSIRIFRHGSGGWAVWGRGERQGRGRGSGT